MKIKLRFQIFQIDFKGNTLCFYSRPPFSIQNEEDSILLARYLVEENQEDWVIFDENRANSVKIVKSVFKNLIKSYELFSKDEY